VFAEFDWVDILGTTVSNYSRKIKKTLIFEDQQPAINQIQSAPADSIPAFLFKAQFEISKK